MLLNYNLAESEQNNRYRSVLEKNKSFKIAQTF